MDPFFLVSVGSCGDRRRWWLVVKARVLLLLQDKADHEGGKVMVEEGVAKKRAVMWEGCNMKEESEATHVL